MSARIIVTGGSGRVGRFVIEELAARGYDVRNLDRRPPALPMPEGVRFVECDLTSSEEAEKVVRDADAVVHLAAIPDPYSDPPERVMAVNTALTLNVCNAVRRNRIVRIVYGSSESATGFGIHEYEPRPLYLPIDEKHPCFPHETYSLSKYFGEVMLAEFARAGWVDAIALRYSWVWLPYAFESARNAVAAARRGVAPERPWLGSFVSPQDVATAVEAAVRYLLGRGTVASGFEPFFITARETFLGIPTLEALRRHFDPLPEIMDPEYFEKNPRASAFDIRKARRILGWTPRFSIDDFETWFVRE